MKRVMFFSTLMLAFGFLAACGSPKPRFHQAPLPDPASYRAHFADMDADGDAAVTWQEFSAHFPAAEPKVFAALDQNKDGLVDHDEWHQFEEAHGRRHKE
ncbi:MAG: hypothetical protein JSW39_05810 [Desulfobacterales bacterium]|nr:MAG: hypothetical protein JSW39_05810 [Desulfobacterales bacterium]